MTRYSSVEPDAAPPLMRAALTAAARGHAVIPLWPRSKRPVLEAWEDEATTDLDRIRERWSSTPYNIGIACGPSNLLVIDLDGAKGHSPPPQWAGSRNGRDVLTRLAEHAGHTFPAKTYTVTTPNGTHLYFQAPDHPVLRSSVGRLGWRIDTRGVGGFVVAPGSIRAAGTYRVLRSDPIAPLPGWLSTALTPDPVPATPATTIETGHLGTYVAAAVAAEGRAVSNAVPGTRHTTLLHAAISLGTLVGAEVLDIDDVRSTLHQAASRHGPDFPAGEIHRTVEDGLAYGIQRPRTLLPRATHNT